MKNFQSTLKGYIKFLDKTFIKFIDFTPRVLNSLNGYLNFLNQILIVNPRFIYTGFIVFFCRHFTIRYEVI